MRVPMFVFAGLPNTTEPIDYVSLLHVVLDSKLSEVVPSLKVNRKDNLLTIRHEQASIYVAIMKEKNEISDWVKMARDFELTVDMATINHALLEKRLDKIKKKFSALYRDIHFDLARLVFNAMNEFSGLHIYAFL